MAIESRTKKSLLNAKVNMICYFISLVISFFSRKIFLDQLGLDFLGFTGTLQSLLGFLNLAELGVGMAIGYVLYKPIYENDKIKICEIISVLGYLYRCIGFIICGVGVILSCFLPFVFPNIPFSWGVIYFSYYSFLVSSLIGYFINYKQSLLSADQRNYEVSGYFQGVMTTKVIVQIILVLYIRSFILYLTIELIFGFVYSFTLNWRINRVYPWLTSDIKLGSKLFLKYPEIAKYVKQLFIHRIAGFFQYQMTPFLIYSYASLPVVALYGNYVLITTKVQGFIEGGLDSTSAGVGHLISEGNKRKIIDTYKELFSVRILIVGVLTACLYYLVSPFIALWLGNEYKMSDFVVFLIILQFSMKVLRGTTDQFIYGYGLFYDLWAPAIEAMLFVIFSIVLGSIWGLAGVLCGPLVSMLIIIYVWKPYFLYSRGFNLSVFKYWIMLIIHIVILLLSYFAAVYLSSLIYPYDLAGGWMEWIFGAFLFSLLMSLFSFSLVCIVSSNFRCFLYRIIKYSKWFIDGKK